MLQAPISLALNYVIIPKLNVILGRGMALPAVTVPTKGYNIHVNLVNPELGFGKDYVLVGADANITVTPSIPGA